MNVTTPTSVSHAFAATLIDAAVNRRDCRTTKRQSVQMFASLSSSVPKARRVPSGETRGCA